MLRYMLLFWLFWIISWTLSTLFVGGGLSVSIALLFGATNGFLILVNSAARNIKMPKIIIGVLLSTFLVYLSGTILLEMFCYSGNMKSLLEGNAICRGGHIYIGFPILLFFISFFGEMLILFPLRILIPKS